MDKDHQNDTTDREHDTEEQSSRRTTASNDPSHREPGAGITNRPEEVERENQERLPPRGEAKPGD